MVTSAIITFCVGMTCSIMESQVDYDTVSASNSVHVMMLRLRAARLRLNGFSEWLRSKTDSDTWDMLGGLDYNINPPLQAIRKTVNIAITQGKDAEHCYTKAHASAMEEAEKYLELIMPCIETFTNTTEATLVDVPNHLHEINNLEKDMIAILPDCYKWTEKSFCIQKRLHRVNSPVLNIDTFADHIVEKGNNDYFAQHDKAIKCLTEQFQNLNKEMSVIRSEANHCVRQS